MSISSTISKLWKTIPMFLSQLQYPKKIPKSILENHFKETVFANNPVLFLLPCVVFLENQTPINHVTSYDVEENISHLMSLARYALEKGDFERAEAILEMGIKISEEYESYAALPYMYDILASISFALGKMGQAEQILVGAVEKLIQVEKKILGISENDGDVIDFQLRLARIYSASSENHLAEIGFQDCLKKQKKKILNGDTSSKTGMLYVNVLFWYGLHKIRQFQPDSAKKLITSAYDYSQKIKGLSPYQEMVILYTLSDLYVQLGDNSMALENMKSAILLGKGIGSLDMPRCYLKLAQIYTKMESWGNAKESALEAEKLATLFGDTVLKTEVNDTLEYIKQNFK